MRYVLQHGVTSKSTGETIWHVFDRFENKEMASKHGRELYSMGVEKLKVVDTQSMHEETVAGNNVGDGNIAGMGNTPSDILVKKKKKLNAIIRRNAPCQMTKSSST